MTLISIFLLMVLLHFTIDIVFQPDFVAKYKSPLASIPAVPWYYVLGGHCASHGLGVFFATQSIFLAVAETTVHFGVDYAKCLGYTNIHQDQAMHIGCKIIWVLLLYFGI